MNRQMERQASWHLFDLMSLAFAGYVNGWPGRRALVEQAAQWLDGDEAPAQTMELPERFRALHRDQGLPRGRRLVPLHGVEPRPWRPDDLRRIALARSGTRDLLRLDSQDDDLAVHVARLLVHALHRYRDTAPLWCLAFRDLRPRWDDLSLEFRTALRTHCDLPESPLDWGEKPLCLATVSGFDAGFQSWATGLRDGLDLLEKLAAGISAPGPIDHDVFMPVADGVRFLACFHRYETENQRSLLHLPYSWQPADWHDPLRPDPRIREIVRIASARVIAGSGPASPPDRRLFADFMASVGFLLHGDVVGPLVQVLIACHRAREIWDYLGDAIQALLRQLSGLPEEPDAWPEATVYLTSSDFLYGVMQRFRHAGSAPREDQAQLLQRAKAFLAGHEPRLPLWFGVPLRELESWDRHAGGFHRAALSVEDPDETVADGPDGHALLQAVKLAIGQLAAFNDQGDVEGLRRLGYAMHVIPHLLEWPEAFEPRSFRFCVGQMGDALGRMDPAMQQALRALCAGAPGK